MRTPFLLLALTALSMTTLQADVLITLDQPDQSGAPGSTLQFFGTITNLDTTGTVYVNSDGLNITANIGDFAIADQFFTTVPLFLSAAGSPGDSSGSIELFDVTVGSPFPDPLTAYGGNYQLLGGVDGDAQNVLGSVSFRVTPTADVGSEVPEPVSALLLLSGVAGMVTLRRGRG